MYLDAQTLVWDAAALTTSADSTNSYDLAAAGNDISQGEPLALVISVDVAALVVGTETYEFQVIQSANSNLSSSDILCSVPFTTALAAARLTAGKIIVIPVPPGSITKRYIGARLVSANSAGITVTAWFTLMSMIQRDKHYADNITIS